MSSDWNLVLDEDAISQLLAARAVERRKLLAALQSLKADPYQTGDFVESDDTGRPLQVKLFVSHLVTWWPDSLVKEIRVVAIEKIRNL